VRVTVRGKDRRGVRRARFAVGRRSFRDRKTPFSRIVDRGRRGRSSKVHRVRVRVLMKDGRRARLTRRYRVCASR
jgi:hypothetical protein